jgi:hypothetical protein
VRLAASARPILLVVVDTEEEFDWSADFDRANVGVEHMRSIGLLQGILDDFHIRPVYAADYPIATQPVSADPLREIQASGRCEIGAHLHPWVSPPFEEEVNARNSYPGNLAPALERSKLERLVEAIERGLGVRPRSYKAGRYGFGPHTGALLEELGFEVDLSRCPPFDFTADGGPDYSRATCDPVWVGPTRRVLAVPGTGGYVGFLRGSSAGLYRLATWPRLRALRLPGILSRLGALDRLHLSPEGFLPEHHRSLTRALFDSGLRTFTFSLHSPSLRPGCTPYVRTEGERALFLDSCRRFFEFFHGELGGTSMTALELKRTLEAAA